MYFRSFRRCLLMMGLVLGGVWVGAVGCSPTGQKSCTKNGDCSANEHCQAGVCTPLARCTSANARFVCRPNEKCEGGVCKPKESTNNPPTGCQSNLDCTDNKLCEKQSGQCVVCLQDSDCQTPGERCTESYVCSSSEPAGEPVVPDQPAGDGDSSCASDADCPSNQKCDLFEKKCVNRDGGKCVIDKECPPGQYCNDTVCRTGRRACEPNPSACQQDYECRDGKCYLKACREDNDCEAGKTCDKQFGLCTGTAQEDCTREGCPTGKTCNATTKKCEDGTTDCTTGGCPTGQTCNATTKQCEGGADCTTSGCPTGQTCNTTTKQCEVSTGEDCTVKGCPNDQQCNLTTKQCETKQTNSCSSNSDCSAPTGACQSGTCQSCATQFTCPAGQNCNISTGVCQAKPCSADGDCQVPTGTCRSGTCQTCATDFTCASGLKCENSSGRCVTPTCTADTDCPAGQRCGFSSPRTCTARSSTCFSDFSCRTDEFCSNSTCTPRQCGSGSGKTCPTGQVCQDYICAKPGAIKRTACTNNLDCSLNDTCLNTAQGAFCYRNCTSNSSCPTGQECYGVPLTDGTTKKLCVGKAVGVAGDSCGGLDNRCATTAACLFDKNGDTTGLCHTSCTPGSSSSCKSTEVCHEYNVGKGACLPKGTKTAGQSCGFTTSRCNDQHTCMYPTSSATNGVCYVNCATPGSQSTCTSANECATLGSTNRYGACLPKAARVENQSCGGTTQRCKTGYVCTNVNNSSICLHSCAGSGSAGNRTCASKTSNGYRTCYDLTSGNGGVCYQ